MVGRERGSALLVAMVTILVITMAVLLVAGYIHQRTTAFEIERRGVITTALVDAAMAETLAELGRDRFFSGVSERAFGDGTISSQVTSQDSWRRRIRAVGVFRRWSAVIEADIDLRGVHPRVLGWTLRQGPAGR